MCFVKRLSFSFTRSVTSLWWNPCLPFSLWLYWCTSSVSNHYILWDLSEMELTESLNQLLVWQISRHWKTNKAYQRQIHRLAIVCVSEIQKLSEKCFDNLAKKVSSRKMIFPFFQQIFNQFTISDQILIGKYSNFLSSISAITSWYSIAISRNYKVFNLDRKMATVLLITRQQ